MNDELLYVAPGAGLGHLNRATAVAMGLEELGVPVRTSPTATQGKVFAVTTEGRLYCLSASDGEEVAAIEKSI